MSYFSIEKPEYLLCGERARLIPVSGEGRKESKVTSAFLASLMAVNEYAVSLFNSIGIRVGKTSKIECFTEVVFKDLEGKIRPDGLIVITTGKSQWKALIESKIGNAALELGQVESYLDIAKQLGIDAVITVSNQFVTDNSHNPLQVNKGRLRSVGLYHWSWTFLMAEAIMWVKHHGISDPDQGYILEELVRYLDHSSSGISAVSRMNSKWSDICSSVQNRIPLNKNSEEIKETINAWQQFSYSLSLKLSLILGRAITIPLKKAYRDDASLFINDNCQLLAQEQSLSTEFDIPDAASRLKVVADFETRSVMISMQLKAPEDKATAKGRINWIIKQLDKTKNDKVLIKAKWPSRSTDTASTLESLRKSGPEVLFNTNKDLVPTSFEICLITDLAGKFRGAQTFVQETEPLVAEFYKDVGQNLKEWVPQPPKFTEDNNEKIPNSLEIESHIAKSTVTKLNLQTEKSVNEPEQVSNQPSSKIVEGA